MKNINDDTKAKLESVVDKITKDSHNRAINDCHHMILGKFDQSKDEAMKNIYSELEKLIVEMYKH